MPTRQVPLTKEGLEKLQNELEELKTSRRVEVAQRIHEAKELVGAQNAPEYEDVRAEQAWVEGRIAEIEDMLQNAVIFEETHNQQQVSLGSHVKVRDHLGKKVTYLIVGVAEASPKDGKISNESPVGMALLGKKVGEAVEIKAPAGTLTWTIEAID